MVCGDKITSVERRDMSESRLAVGTKAFLIARVSDPSQRDALPGQELRLNDYSSRKQMDGTLYSFD